MCVFFVCFFCVFFFLFFFFFVFFSCSGSFLNMYDFKLKIKFKILVLGNKALFLSHYRSLSFVFIWPKTYNEVGWGLMVCLWSGPRGFNCWISIAPAF